MKSGEVHVMLDLETLATKPWSVILSVGAVAFDPTEQWTDDPNRPSFYSNVDPETCVEAGLVADPNTAKWWMHPDRRDAMRQMSVDKRPLREVVGNFNSWFAGVGAKYVWAHGAPFDVPIWETACGFIGERVPWKFTDVRDTRTVFHLCGVEFRNLVKEGTYHNAVHDAANQAREVSRCVGVLIGGR